MLGSFLLFATLIAGLVALYLFILQDEMAKKVMLITLIAVILLSIIVLAIEFSRGPHRVRAKIREIEPLLSQQSAEMLKDKYVQIYELYLKLPEKWKQNFYAKVTSIRERVEEQLRAEKKLVFLLEQSDKAPLAELKQLYTQLYASFQKLPEQVQGHYYYRVIALKEKMEKGF